MKGSGAGGGAMTPAQAGACGGSDGKRLLLVETCLCIVPFFQRSGPALRNRQTAAWTLVDAARYPPTEITGQATTFDPIIVAQRKCCVKSRFGLRQGERTGMQRGIRAALRCSCAGSRCSTPLAHSMRGLGEITRKLAIDTPMAKCYTVLTSKPVSIVAPSIS